MLVNGQMIFILKLMQKTAEYAGFSPTVLSGIHSSPGSWSVCENATRNHMAAAEPVATDVPRQRLRRRKLRHDRRDSLFRRHEARAIDQVADYFESAHMKTNNAHQLQQHNAARIKLLNTWKSAQKNLLFHFFPKFME